MFGQISSSDSADQQKVDDSRSERNFLLWAAADKSQFVFSFWCLFYIWAAAQTHTPDTVHKASIFKKKGEGNMHFSCSAGFAWINTTTPLDFPSTWPEGSAAHGLLAWTSASSHTPAWALKIRSALQVRRRDKFYLHGSYWMKSKWETMKTRGRRKWNEWN